MEIYFREVPGTLRDPQGLHKIIGMCKVRDHHDKTLPTEGQFKPSEGTCLLTASLHQEGSFRKAGAPWASFPAVSGGLDRARSKPSCMAHPQACLKDGLPAGGR